jgi:hypothetical protein
MLYYDPFDDREEEEFFEFEKERSRREVSELLSRLENTTSTRTSTDPRTRTTKDALSLTEIELDVPLLEPKSLALLMEGIYQSTHDVARLSFSQWGLGDAGVAVVAEMLAKKNASIKSLSLPNCGISNLGLEVLMTTLATSPTSTLTKLDLSRNNLRGGNNSLNSILQELLPHCSSLRELTLASTGLDVVSIQSLLTGVINHPSLLSLDISNNFDSLESLLDCLMEYLPRFRSLQRLVLARGASSSTCIDYQNLEVLARLIKRTEQNTSLHFLGPLSVLPLDRQSCSETHMLHTQCLEHVDRIHYLLERNKCQSFIRGLLHNHPLSILPTALTRIDRQSRHPNSIRYHLLRETSSLLMSKR